MLVEFWISDLAGTAGWNSITVRQDLAVWLCRYSYSYPKMINAAGRPLGDMDSTWTSPLGYDMIRFSTAQHRRNDLLPFHRWYAAPVPVEFANLASISVWMSCSMVSCWSFGDSNTKLCLSERCPKIPDERGLAPRLDLSTGPVGEHMFFMHICCINCLEGS